MPSITKPIHPSMPSFSPIPAPGHIIIRYNGLFDFDALYAVIVDWAKHHGYMWTETEYKHKVPRPSGAEQNIKWKFTKKVNEYIHYEIRFHLHTWDQREVEVEIGNEKKSLTNARMHITIWATLTFDWQKRFKGSTFSLLLGDWYRNVVMKKEVESLYNDQLYYRVWNLHNIIKKYFDMQTKKYAYKGYLKEH